MARDPDASASTPPAPRQPRPPCRIQSSGSFHAGAPIPHLASSPLRRQSSSLSPSGRRSSFFPSLRRPSTVPRYQTFSPADAKETTPAETDPEVGPDARRRTPKRDGRAAEQTSSPSSSSTSSSSTPSRHGHDATTPLPWKQLGLLALLSLAEQTALNSISPYLPTMVASFDEVPPGQEGLYVGLLASAFALAQLTTNLLWGYLSDTVGRRPVMLAGTTLLAACFAAFGFCRDFAQLTVVHVAMGLLNGNAAVVPTCLGEVTDRSNQSRAFIWLPVMYSIGGITGPALGGLLVGSSSGVVSAYPFLAPNLVSAALLLASVAVLAVWFDETLDGADQKAAGAGLAWVERISRWGSLFRRHNGDGEDESASDEDGHDYNDTPEHQTLLGSRSPSPTPDGSAANGNGTKTSEAQIRSAAFRQLANRTTLAVLVTYLFFQVANISFNSLYPIFATAPPPTGRDLGPGIIGLSLSLAGLATILFQVFFFEPLKCRMGNLGTYKASLLGIALSMALMPWVGYREGGHSKAWLYSELGVILVIKNICAVSGLSSVMLLITNSAPSHEMLGTLNGIAQTLSAAGRSVGPFISGGLFTLSMRVRPKGEALAWGLFAGVALAGWLGTFVIRGSDLESDDWVGLEGGEDEAEETDGSE